MPPGTPIITGGAWGWPETSLAIAESICDVSGLVADLFESIDTSGKQRGGSGEDGFGSTGELVQEQNLVAKPEIRSWKFSKR